MLRDRDRQLVDLLDRFSSAEAAEAVHEPTGRGFDGITFVIAAYNIPKQLERTLFTCSAQYQSADPSQIEVIIVDNGSTPAVPNSLRASHPEISKILRFEGDPSPVKGLNAAIAQAEFSNIALMIDGAHMLSPGVFKNAREVLTSMRRPVINVPQFMLGDVSQNFGHVAWAFERESENLERLGWPRDGYSLFRYATRPTEFAQRGQLHFFESNCLISTKAVFDECGAFDERFDEPGAGMANVEMFWRLIHEPTNRYVVLPGEGSFHQDHGGTTTSLRPDERKSLVTEFRRTTEAVTGVENLQWTRSPHVHGTVFNSAQEIPTISKDYGEAKTRLLNELSALYVEHAITGEPVPRLHLSKKPVVDEHKVRPRLAPLGLRDRVAKEAGCEPARVGYREVLEHLHAEVHPSLYLEIGVDNGDSLQLARCRSVGIDPAFEVNCTQNQETRLFKNTSDGFFSNEKHCARVFHGGVDLAYIDGLHISENVVRDFINVEKWSNPTAVAVLDDVLPEQLAMAGRERPFNAWCGDVYKVLPILQDYRPDLQVAVVEAFAGPYRKGLAVISNLDPENQTLLENYDEILQRIESGFYTVGSIAELESIAPIVPIASLSASLWTDGDKPAPNPLRHRIETLEAGEIEFESPVRQRQLIALRAAEGRRLITNPPLRQEVSTTSDIRLPVGKNDVPQCEIAALQPSFVRSGIASHGSLVVHNAIDSDVVAELVDGVESALSADADSRFEFGGLRGLVAREWVGSTDSVLLCDVPGMMEKVLRKYRAAGLFDLAADVLGCAPVLSAKKCTLRRVPADSNGQWHQDGAFLGAGIGALNYWLALTDCGEHAPTIDIVPKRIDHIVETGSAGALFDWSVGESVAIDIAGPQGVTRTHFEAGDMILFDEMMLHKTATSPTMSSPRYAIEFWVFHPATFPAGDVALAW